MFLARAGHRISWFERFSTPAPIGAGIVLQPTGQAVLAELGLLGSIASRAARIDRLLCVSEHGRTLVDLSYSELAARVDARRDGAVDPHGLGVHRGVLFETLFAAAKSEGCEMHLGTEIQRTSSDAAGRWLNDAEGDTHGPFDLVVVADGAGSTLLDPSVSRRTSPYAWGALWAVVKGHPSQGGARMLFQRVRSARQMLGILPTGRGPGADGDELVSLYWSLRADTLEVFRRRGLQAWKAEVLALEPDASPLLERIEDLSQLVFGAYRDVSMRRWHGERIVWLGDAAHAMSPQLGQGANLALSDARGLAQALSQQPSVGAALAEYTRARRAPLEFYQRATRALTPLFQSDSRVMGIVRDVVMPLGLAIPYVRRRMVQSMAGLERGVLRPALPVPRLQLGARAADVP